MIYKIEVTYETGGTFRSEVVTDELWSGTDPSDAEENYRRFLILCAVENGKWKKDVPDYIKYEDSGIKFSTPMCVELFTDEEVELTSVCEYFGHFEEVMDVKLVVELENMIDGDVDLSEIFY